MIADWRLAEALAIQRLHGHDAARWVAERTAVLADAGDVAGVERFAAIGEKLDGLLTAGRRPC